ncbi:MAG TPA: TMEM175 family protein [Thermoplasmata archaeon]|nr:TMEM175 family protein [Thermoplasmata archaeon]
MALTPGLPSGAERRAYEGLDGSGTDLGRLLSLSDGVFAFSLTFLVVSLLLPAPGTTAEPSLTGLLSRLEPGFLAYALSFFIIATWWETHHRLFSPLVRYDATLVRLNNFFLLVISITPFLVDLLFVYGPGKSTPIRSTQLAIVLYAGVQALGGLDLLVIWRHATRGHRLVDPTLPDEWIRGTELNQAAVVAVFLASMPVALLSPVTAELVWIVMVFVRIHRRAPRPAPAKA